MKWYFWVIIVILVLLIVGFATGFLSITKKTKVINDNNEISDEEWELTQSGWERKTN